MREEKIANLTAAILRLAEAIEVQSQNQVSIVDFEGLAELLDVSERSVRRLDATGTLPSPLKIGNRKRWLVEDIHTWLKAGAPGRGKWAAKRH